jgi:MbnP
MRTSASRFRIAGRRHFAFAVLAPLALALTFSGCLDFEASNPLASIGSHDPGSDSTGGGDEPPPPPPAPPGSLRIHFRTRAGGQVLGRHPGELNTSGVGEQFFSSDLQYLVSGFGLEGVDADGDPLEYESDVIHLVDAVTDQTGNTHFVTLENIPQGTYRTVRFRMGITDAQQALLDPDKDLELTFGTFHLEFKLNRADGRFDYFRHVGLVFPTFANVSVGMGPAGGQDFSSDVRLDLADDLVVEEETTATLEATLDINGLYGDRTFAQLSNGGSSESVQTLLRDNAADAAWTVRVP